MEGFDFVGTIATRGFGYVLFLATVYVLYKREKMWNDKMDAKDLLIKDIADKRTADLERIKDTDFKVFEQMRVLDEEKTTKQNDLINRMLYILEGVQKFLEKK